MGGDVIYTASLSGLAIRPATRMIYLRMTAARGQMQMCSSQFYCLNRVLVVRVSEMEYSPCLIRIS